MASRRVQPTVLGLTGPTACGKTTVGDLLLRLGALDRIDTDRVVHRLLAGGDTADRVVDAFGRDILDSDGRISRRKLAAEVFSNPAALEHLEAIVHPAVRNVVREDLRNLHNRPGIVVIDAVKLLQSDLLPLCGAVWVVQCDRHVELRRLMGIRAMTEDEALARLAAQPSFDHPSVTAVIHNNGSHADLEARVTALWTGLLDGQHLTPSP